MLGRIITNLSATAQANTGAAVQAAMTTALEDNDIAIIFTLVFVIIVNLALTICLLVALIHKISETSGGHPLLYTMAIVSIVIFLVVFTICGISTIFLDEY